MSEVKSLEKSNEKLGILNIIVNFSTLRIPY